MAPRPESNEAISERLKLLRALFSGENQRQFAARLGIEPRRWGNFENGFPFSKEVALLIVQKFPNITLGLAVPGEYLGAVSELEDAAGQDHSRRA
jgi:hypothetical protein